MNTFAGERWRIAPEDTSIAPRRHPIVGLHPVRLEHVISANLQKVASHLDG